MNVESINVDSLVRLFRIYLNDSWEVVSKFSILFPEENQEEFFNDFLQAGWEMLVEQPLNIFLEEYGYGSDLNESSRVWDSFVYESYNVICKINKRVKECYTSEFVDFKEGLFKYFVNEYFDIEPPFNIAIVSNEDNNEFAFNIDDITFDLEKNE